MNPGARSGESGLPVEIAGDDALKQDVRSGLQAIVWA
jgi:hypothetical protein